MALLPPLSHEAFGFGAGASITGAFGLVMASLSRLV